MWAPNMRPVPRVWFHFRPHSNVSSVGHGVAEGKPGTESSDRSLEKLLSHKLKIFDQFITSISHTEIFLYLIFLSSISFICLLNARNFCLLSTLNFILNDRIYFLNFTLSCVSTWEKFKKIVIICPWVRSQPNLAPEWLKNFPRWTTHISWYYNFTMQSTKDTTRMGGAVGSYDIIYAMLWLRLTFVPMFPQTRK